MDVLSRHDGTTHRQTFPRGWVWVTLIAAAWVIFLGIGYGLYKIGMFLLG